MNLALLGAILDTIDCTFEELCPITVQAVPDRATGTVDAAAKKDAFRPARARVRRPERVAPAPPLNASAATAQGFGLRPPGPRGASVDAATNEPLASTATAQAAAPTASSPDSSPVIFSDKITGEKAARHSFPPKRGSPPSPTTW